MTHLNLCPNSNCEKKCAPKINHDKNTREFWGDCPSCGVAGPIANSKKDAGEDWSLFPRNVSVKKQ